MTPKDDHPAPGTDGLDWDRIEALFLDARVLDSEGRQAFLVREAADDPAVRAEVEGLLENDRSDDFLNAPGDATLLGVLGGMVATPEDLTGTTILGQYELGTRIGTGASSAVYAAQDKFTKQQVAVKIIGRRDLGDLARRELASLRTVRTHGVVSLIDHVEDPTLGTCLVMEMIVGEPLGRAFGPRPWHAVQPILAALLDTLARVHARGMLHRDLKPDNILVQADGAPVILDLGISSLGPGTALSGSTPIGTPAYMAPEVALGALPDERGDLHALGLIVVEVLAGEAAYSGDTLDSLVPAKARLALADVDAWLAALDLPKAGTTLLRALLHPDPTQRPVSARAARALLPGNADIAAHPAIQAGSAAGLRALFQGPERLLHLPTDAARELYRRTHAEPKAVVAELEAWQHARLGYWEDAGFVIDRAAILLLQDGLHPRIPAKAPRVPDPVPGVRELLPVVRCLQGALPADCLGRAAGVALAVRDQALAALRESGIIEIRPDGEILLTASGLALPRPPRPADIAGRLANACAPGHPARLALLSAAGRRAEIAAEAVEAVKVAFEGASLETCVHLAELGLNSGAAGEAEFELLAYMLRASIPQTRLAAVERALAWIERSTLTPERRPILQSLAQAAVDLLQGRHGRALATAADSGPSTHPCVEAVRGGLLTFAIRHAPPDKQEALTRTHFGPVERAESNAELSAWAWCFLLTERYAEAAPLFERLVALAPHLHSRLSQQSNLLYVQMQLFAHDACEPLAHALLAQAREGRLAQVEAHAEYDLRCIAYAKGLALKADSELVEAAGCLGARLFFEQILLLEAAVAWRQGDLPRARDWLSECCARLGTAKADLVNDTGRALWLLVDPEASPDTAATVLERIPHVELTTDVIEITALVAMHEPHAIGAATRARFREALASCPAATWKFRRDVLSIEEAVKSVLGDAQG